MNWDKNGAQRKSHDDENKSKNDRKGNQDWVMNYLPKELPFN